MSMISSLGIVVHDARDPGKPAVPVGPLEAVLLLEEHPQNFSTFGKWVIVVVISCTACCATCTSSVVRICIHIRR